VTVNVYAVPFVSPVYPIGLVPIAINPPGVDTAENVVVPVPPVPPVNGTLADALPAVTVPIVTAPGLLPAVTEFEAEDVAVPNSVVAVTVNVYATPAVKPETRIGDAPDAVIPPGEEVAVYVTEPEVPVDPAVYGTSIFLSTFCTMTAVPIVGASGPTPITSEALAPDTSDSTPLTEAALTVKVTVDPAVKPLTSIGLEDPVPVWPELAVTM
jgi:hypothetical protein